MSGRLGAALAAIEDQFQLVFETILDFPAFGERQFVTRQLQGRGQQRLVEFLKQGQCHWVGRDAQADGLALGMQHPARQLLGAFEDEGVATRRRALATILGVVRRSKVAIPRDRGPRVNVTTSPWAYRRTLSSALRRAERRA